jgi:hypothetical protein
LANAKELKKSARTEGSAFLPLQELNFLGILSFLLSPQQISILNTPNWVMCQAPLQQTRSATSQSANTANKTWHM